MPCVRGIQVHDRKIRILLKDIQIENSAPRTSCSGIDPTLYIE